MMTSLQSFSKRTLTNYESWNPFPLVWRLWGPLIHQLSFNHSETCTFSLVLTNPPVTCQIIWHLHYATMNRTAVWALPVFLWRLQISWQQQCNAQLTRTWLWIRDSFTAHRSGTSSGNSSGCFVGVSSPLGGFRFSLHAATCLTNRWFQDTEALSTN